MGVINPESGAIDNYKFVEAQENYVGILKAISTAQSGINTDYEFEVGYNVFRPTIQNDLKNKSFVNVLIGNVISQNSSRQNKDQEVEFYFDCYQLGENEDPYPADEVAVQRLQYLCAMVEYGLTALQNYYASLGQSGNGEIRPGELSLQFNSVEDADDSFKPYAPARFTQKVMFSYTAATPILPDLETITIDLQNYALELEV